MVWSLKYCLTKILPGDTHNEFHRTVCVAKIYIMCCFGEIHKAKYHQKNGLWNFRFLRFFSRWAFKAFIGVWNIMFRLCSFIPKYFPWSQQDAISDSPNLWGTPQESALNTLFLILWYSSLHFLVINIRPSNEYSGLISFRMDGLHLLAVQGTFKNLLQHHSSKASILQCSAFFRVQRSHPYMNTGKIKS